MAVTRQSDRRKNNRRTNHRGKGHIRIIKIEEEGGNEQEMTVHCKTAPQKRGASVWSWQEEFVIEWSETFLTKKKDKYPRKGE